MTTLKLTTSFMFRIKDSIIDWLHKDAAGNLLKHDTLQLRQFFPQEIDHLLKTAGFQIREKYGNWQRDPMSASNFKQILVTHPLA